MPKKPEKDRLVVVNFSLHRIHLQMIRNLLREKPFTSQADIVRQAIVMFHDKTLPDYVYKETAAGEIKKSKKQEEDAFNSLTDEEYATDILQAPIYDSESGDKFVLVHTVGNSVAVFRLDGLKDMMSRSVDIVDFHLRRLREQSIKDSLTPLVIRTLQKQYGITGI